MKGSKDEDLPMNDEILKAQTAKEQEVTLFDRIVRREIPAQILFEDDIVYFHFCNIILRLWLLEM